jgi:membrane protein YdbS with pleckstrin-like domain
MTMELVVELVLTLFLEGGIEASKDRRISRPIRYVLVLLIALFFIAVFGLLIWMGILACRRTLLGGGIVILLGMFLLVWSAIQFRRVYVQRRKQNDHPQYN